MRWGLSKGEENARVVLTDTSQVPITLLQQSHFTAYSCRLNNRAHSKTDPGLFTRLDNQLGKYMKSNRHKS